MIGIINSPRFGGFKPTDIPGLELWLDAADRGSTPLRWDDLSGKNRHFTSTSDSTFPSFAGGVATFNGTTHELSRSGIALSAGEIFGRLKLDSDPPIGANQTGLWRWQNQSGGIEHYPYTDGVAYMATGSTTRKTTGNPSANLTAWHTLNVISINGEWTMQINGSTHFTTGINTAGWGTFATVGVHSSPYRFDGQMRAILLYSRKLTTDERAKVNDYLTKLLVP